MANEIPRTETACAPPKLVFSVGRGCVRGKGAPTAAAANVATRYGWSSTQLRSEGREVALGDAERVNRPEKIRKAKLPPAFTFFPNGTNILSPPEPCEPWRIVWLS